MTKSISFSDLTSLQKKAALEAKKQGYFSGDCIELEHVYKLLSDFYEAPERKRDHELLGGAESLTTLLEKTKTNFVKL